MVRVGLAEPRKSLKKRSAAPRATLFSAVFLYASWIHAKDFKTPKWRLDRLGVEPRSWYIAETPAGGEPLRLILTWPEWGLTQVHEQVMPNHEAICPLDFERRHCLPRSYITF